MHTIIPTKLHSAKHQTIHTTTLKAHIRIGIILVAILLFSSVFRFVGMKWDEGYHLHPDERFLVMVAGSMKWFDSIGTYFNTDNSQINPHNIGHSFYVYGTFPVLLVKTIAVIINQDTYHGLLYIGRYMSASIDIVTLCIVMIIAWRYTKQHIASIISGILYATAALPIQQSHFFTTDPYLVCFFAGAWASALYGNPILTGILFGLSFSSKISALYGLPFLIITFLLSISAKKSWKLGIVSILTLGFVTLLTVRICYPYIFSGSAFIPTGLNPKVIDNLKQLSSFNDPSGFFPPSIQWIKTTPIIFPLLNMAYFGFGIPHISIISLSILFIVFKKRVNIPIGILGAFIGCVFLYQGIQFVKALRYFYILYPFLAVLGGIGIYIGVEKANSAKIRVLTVSIFFIASLV